MKIKWLGRVVTPPKKNLQWRNVMWRSQVIFLFLKVIFATKVNFTSWILYAITIRCTLNPSKFLKNILTLYIIIQYYYYFITLQVYILMLTPIALDPPSYSPFAISSWFLKNENKFLINLTIITYQVKLNYSSRTSNNTYWNIKGVSSYSDAGMS